MKKFFVLAGMAAILTACNNDGSSDNTVNNDSLRQDSINQANSASSNYQAAEGDVSYRNGKLVVWRNNAWVDNDADVTLDNDVVVRRSGRVERNGDTVELEDGEVVTKTGRFFDRAGNAIEDAWDATKRGAKKVGSTIEKGADKAAGEVKDALKDDDKKKNN